MARLRPPQYRSDQTNATVILKDDDAWDHERIEAEKATMSKADAEDHPVQRYWAGKDRYDLDAPVTMPDGSVATARDYLDETKRPEEYIIRRLSPQEWERVQTAYSQDGVWLRAARIATEMALVAVKGSPQAMPVNKRGHVTEEDVQILFDLGILVPLGLAAYMHSRPLTTEEKKASAS